MPVIVLRRGKPNFFFVDLQAASYHNDVAEQDGVKRLGGCDMKFDELSKDLQEKKKGLQDSRGAGETGKRGRL